MTRYSADHKTMTREKIVRAAARLFRRHGYDGVGIDTVMAAAALTRGGFYGHFKSKAALYQAVLEGDHDFVQRLRAREGSSAKALNRQARQIAHDYLAPAHRAQVLKGCSLAALSADTTRADDPARKAYANAVRELAGEFSRGIEAGDPGDPRGLQAVLACVGGLLVASACGTDKALSTRVSLAAQALVDTILSD